ncbi:MAG: cell wall assembly/cell proliferation coordinating protein, KNR4-like protein, partial [Lachnospiraceae bacterium]|nr:cell wall assembly/cell proliferation coordinating protein, KNR4-like protein [Lachnospiraceae bacterium]
TENNNLNVVFVTEYWRKKNSNISKEFYVIEDLKIDNVVFWQDRKGDIYQTIGNEVPKKMYESLLEYIKST